MLSLISPRIALYAALCGLLAAFAFTSYRYAYNTGYAAAEAAQAEADARDFREIIKEYNDATDSPISDDAADCLLRRLAGIGEGEDCGAL